MTIAINTAKLYRYINELKTLSDTTELRRSQRAVQSAIPRNSLGESYTAAKAFAQEIEELNECYFDLVAQTIAVLESAEVFFTKTDDELASYLSERGQSQW